MAGQLTDLVHSNGSQVLVSSHYALDVLGRRTAQTREDSVSEKYGYDTTSQLTSVDYGASPAKHVIDEDAAPAAAAHGGTTVDADGFAANGVMYKVDGSTCATIDCSGDTWSVNTCVNFAAKCLGERAVHEVPWNEFGGGYKTPPYPLIPPLVL